MEMMTNEISNEEPETQVKDIYDGNEFLLTLIFSSVFTILNLENIGFLIYSIFQNTYGIEVDITLFLIATIPMIAVACGILIIISTFTHGHDFRIKWNIYYGFFLSFQMIYSLICGVLFVSCFSLIIKAPPNTSVKIYSIVAGITFIDLLICNLMMYYLNQIYRKNY